MSSGPDYEGARKLNGLARRYYQADVDCTAAARERDAAEKRRDKAATVLETTRKQIVAQLHEMDCAANHNHGWEHRITALLAMMMRESPAPGDTPKDATTKGSTCNP